MSLNISSKSSVWPGLACRGASGSEWLLEDGVYVTDTLVGLRTGSDIWNIGPCSFSAMVDWV